jgi:uncharacterized protein (DUF2252 family)
MAAEVPRYARLLRSVVFKSAPRAWVCGGLHLECLWPLGDNGLVHFDVDDFDESIDWDALRLLTSLQAVVGGLSVGGIKVQALCQRLLDTYTSALVPGESRLGGARTGPGTGA